MAFQISGLDPARFTPLFSLSDDALKDRGILRKRVTAHPGFPCRITLEDAAEGETVLLLNHESHAVETPFRSAYAIYVRENAREAARYETVLPPVLRNRAIALRQFDASGILVGADMFLPHEDGLAVIERALAHPDVAYIHAHNAKHGCFAAEIRPL